MLNGTRLFLKLRKQQLRTEYLNETAAHLFSSLDRVAIDWLLVSPNVHFLFSVKTGT